MVALLIAASLIITQGPESFTALYDHWPGLVTASIVNSAVQAFYVYAASFGEGRLLALGGNSGNVLYDVSFAPFLLPAQEWRDARAC